MSFQSASTSRVVFMSQAEFTARFGSPDFTGAVCGYTPAADTHAVLTLLAYARPRRVLEVGTALGHMTANFSRWTLDDAQIFSLGIVQGMERSAPGAAEQRVDEPTRGQFARFADHLGKAWKVFFITADSMLYDFGRLAPLDFAFIDGGHDLEHVLNDSRKAYEALARGGWLVWHDFYRARGEMRRFGREGEPPCERSRVGGGSAGASPSQNDSIPPARGINSPVPWVKVREAIERLGFSEPVVHVEGTQVAFLRKQAPLPPPRSDMPFSGPVRVAWEGDPEGLHSLALVNRALCRALLDCGHDVGLIWDSKTAADAILKVSPLDARLAERVGRGPARGQAQVHVGHQWPPRLERPAQGRWVLMRPWEFGSLPKSWLPALHHVDEVWAYSRSVRDCYLDAGMPAERVHVIPLGVDPEVFRFGLEPLALPSGPDFRFLFVGGTIFRKGIDVLISAFARAFEPGDGVGLVIKDMGSKSFYRGQTAEASVAALRERGYSVEYLERDLGEEEIAGLYAACDCLVHPFRGEGFALPVVEAMACGLPVIVTRAGPALDYASEETAFLIPARRGNFEECRVGDLETIGRPWLWEPDQDALVELLRRVVADPAAARAKGMAASERIRERFTWARSAEAIEKRLHVLAGKGEDARGGVDPCYRTGLASATPVVATGQSESAPETRACAVSRSGFQPDSPLPNGLACPSLTTVTVSALQAGPSTSAGPPTLALPDVGTHIGGGEKQRRPQAKTGTQLLADRPTFRPGYVPSFVTQGSPSRRLASGAPTALAVPGHPAKVSLTMIVRDEQENLPQALESVRGLFDEIIVVDTGSRDRTIEIARSFGARVFDFVWVDDFAAARNAALARATGDYAFWLDADDLIEPPERTKLEALLGSLGRGEETRAFVVRCACDAGPHGEGGETVVDHIRLFPVIEGVRWTYRVHEQILPALKRAGVPVQWTDITVRHTGYADRALRSRKLERDSRILLEELAERPDDPFSLFNLGSIAIERTEWNEALGYLKRSLARSAPADSITKKLFALIARAHQMRGDPRSALQACDEGLSLDPEDAELWFRKAVAHRQNGEPGEAEQCFRRILELSRPQKFASMDQGIYGHLTRRNLAVLARERGDFEEAQRQWQAVLAECPGDREARKQLG